MSDAIQDYVIDLQKTVEHAMPRLLRVSDQSLV